MERTLQQAYLEPKCEVIEIKTEQIVCGSIEAPDFSSGYGLDLGE